MKKRPLVFTLLFILHMGIALNMPLQIMWLYEHDWREMTAVLNKLTFTNWMVIAISLLNALLSLKASKWLKLTLPLSFLIIVFNNVLISLYGNDYSFLETTLASLIFLMSHSGLFFLKASDVLQHPTLRWWLVPRRFNLKLPLWIETSAGERIELNTFDISKTGAFLVMKAGTDIQLQEGQELTIQLPDIEMTHQFKAQLIRKTQASGKYPPGLGVQFKKMSFSTRLYLTKLFLWNSLKASLSA